MKKIIMITVMVALAMSVSPLAGFADDHERGMILSLSCAGCHNTDGKSILKQRPVYGKSAKYIEKKMKGYKNDGLASTIMGRIAKGYSDSEISSIAKYFASLKK